MKIGGDVRYGGAPPPGPWAQRRIAFHASSSYTATPAMEPLNEPMARGGHHHQQQFNDNHNAQQQFHHHHQQQYNQNHHPHPQNRQQQQNHNQQHHNNNQQQHHNNQQQQLGNGNSKFRKSEAQSLPSSMPLQWTAPQKIGAGLVNLGNTCFLNSVLQCLTYTPPLSGYLQSGLHKASCTVAGFCAFCALQEHVQQVFASSREVSPHLWARNIRSICRHFRSGRQEDSHEYMRYLLDALHKCCLPRHLARDSNSKSSQEKSLVYRIFAGQLRSQVRCSVCSHCSNTYDPFLDLSLDILRADSLPKAFSRFTAVDILDGDNKYKCPRCDKEVRAQKHFTIDTVPNILTIQFKRFTNNGGQGGKIDKKVDFGTTLDLRPFVSNGQQDSLPMYKLFGVLVHKGATTHSGHYYSFLRASSDLWHVFDDSRVRQVAEKTVLDQKAYMLFYVREGKRASNIQSEANARQKPLSLPVTVPSKDIQSKPLFIPRQTLLQSARVVPVASDTKPEAEVLPKDTFPEPAAALAVETQSSLPTEISSEPLVELKGSLQVEAVPVEAENVVNDPLPAENGVVCSNNASLTVKGSDHGNAEAIAPAPVSKGSDHCSSEATAPAPIASVTEEAAVGDSVHTVECSVPAQDGDDSKNMEMDGRCTTSGTSGVEDEWDEYYRKGWNPSGGSGSTPQNFMKMLRVIPHTRRYYQARAVTGRRSSSKALSSANGEVENGHPVVVEASVANVNNDLKRPHTPIELHGSKRLQLGSGLFTCVSAEESHEEIETMETIAGNDERQCIQENGSSACQEAAPEELKLGLRICVGNGVHDQGCIQSCEGKMDEKGLAEANGHLDTANGCFNESHNIRERQQSGAELRVVENCQSLDKSDFKGTGNTLISKRCSKLVAENGCALQTSENSLYGSGVPRWDDVDQDQGLVRNIDKLLESEKGTGFIPDMWDTEYDRGRSKKVRNKSNQEPHETRISIPGTHGMKSDNPFQSFVIGRKKGNNLRVGNGTAFKAGSGYATKAGKSIGGQSVRSDGPI